MKPLSQVTQNYSNQRYRNSEGVTLVVHDWPTLDKLPRALIVIVHGLGEHGARYHHVAQYLNDQNYAVRAYDHVGHGASDGKRGCLAHAEQLLYDLSMVLDRSCEEFGQKLPIFLLGHSMGGLVAADFVAKKIRSVAGLILSSPVLAVDLSYVQKLLLGLLPKMLPNLCLANGVKAQYLSHYEDAEKNYRADPLVHNRISSRLAHFIIHELKNVQKAAHNWKTPTLLLYAGDDRQVASRGSREFAEKAPQEVLKAFEFSALYHEILNEEASEPVFVALSQWLGERV